jgi:hypothetical protein
VTAEIVIMNREAVAIAADRGVSIVTGPPDNPQEIITSATKIFGLPQDHAISFMIYNNATFLGIPWEPLITRFERIPRAVPAAGPCRLCRSVPDLPEGRAGPHNAFFF